MSEFEMFFRNEGSEYGDGVVLNKYGDRYSIIAAREGKDNGTIWKEWCFPQGKDKKAKERSIPLGVRLGTYTETVKTLKAILAALEKPASDRLQEKVADRFNVLDKAAAAAKTMGGRVVDDEQIPF